MEFSTGFRYSFILLPGQTVIVAGKTKNVNHFENLAKGE